MNTIKKVILFIVICIFQNTMLAQSNKPSTISLKPLSAEKIKSTDFLVAPNLGLIFFDGESKCLLFEDKNKFFIFLNTIDIDVLKGFGVISEKFYVASLTGLETAEKFNYNASSNNYQLQ
ncbi:MAG: hypothetical protein H7141_01790 [Burkholderiales bacterium]|nr:hypothetical protein [Bacteroidia bacterium]